MYKITIKNQAHYIQSPHWIQQLKGLAKIINAGSFETAQGIKFNDTFYQIDGKDPMQGDFEVCTVEQADEPEPAETIQSLQQRIAVLEDVILQMAETTAGTVDKVRLDALIAELDDIKDNTLFEVFGEVNI
jgi:hypothetical protein